MTRTDDVALDAAQDPLMLALDIGFTAQRRRARRIARHCTRWTCWRGMSRATGSKYERLSVRSVWQETNSINSIIHTDRPRI